MEEKQVQEKEEIIEAEVVEENDSKAAEVVDSEVIETEDSVIADETSDEEKVETVNLEEFEGVMNVTKYDYRTMMYSNVYIVKYKRKTMLMYIVMLLVVLGFGIYNLISQFNSENPSFIFPVIFLLFAVYIAFQGLNVEKNLDKQIRNFFKGKEVMVQENYINDENIIIKRKDDEPIKIDWIQIQEIHEIPQFYLLFINPNSPLIIEKNPESFKMGTLSELKAIIDEKASMKPYKKLDKEIIKHELKYKHEEDIEEIK